MDAGLPPAQDHLVAVAGGVAWWTDRLQVFGLRLADGVPVFRTVPLSPAPVGLERPEGETFAPAADAAGAAAAIEDPQPGPWGRVSGALIRVDAEGRLRESRGSKGDVDYPRLRRRYLYHGAPLLLGDRVYATATEAGADRPGTAADVRTHVLAFRRESLAPVWDTYLSYGSGLRGTGYAPAGSLAALHGRLYLATHTGVEACLDARTGAVLWARRYRTPRVASTTGGMDRVPIGSEEPQPWPESPPAFSGRWVAFAPRDSYRVDFLLQRPDPASGQLCSDDLPRPRRDRADLTTLWVLPGPAGAFFLAGKAGTEEAPLVLRTVRPDAESGILWRGAVMEPAVVGRPALAAGAVYVATEKAIYRVPYPVKDGEVERLAARPSALPDGAVPTLGNLFVLPDAVISVSEDGVMCFGAK